jgi:rod shape-determining protein MreC
MGNTRWLAVFALVLAAVAAWNLPRLTAGERLEGALRDGLSPLQEAAHGGATRFREAVRYLRGVGDLVSENRALRREAEELRSRLAVLEEAEDRSRAYRELLGFAKGQPRSLVACEVVGRDTSGWWQAVRVDKGEEDGVRPSRAVIAYPGALAGRTVQTSRHTAEVMLVSDPETAVSVRVGDPGTPSGQGVFGVMKGLGGERGGRGEDCVVEFLSNAAELAVGDEVKTSGLGGVYPKGIRVGTVTRLEGDATGLYRKAWVKADADIARVEYLFVVQDAEDKNPIPPAPPDEEP